MRSSDLTLSQYNTDKIENHYLEIYDQIFEPLIENRIILLEIGVNKGGSLLLWRDYFPYGRIVGIDISLPQNLKPMERVKVFKGSQTDRQFLSDVAMKTAPGGYDIIIDDASHIGKFTKISFWHLFDNHLKPGGIYVIEDWGTGYWDDWPDGKSINFTKTLKSVDTKIFSAPVFQKILKIMKIKTPIHCHSYGMVGFIKELV